jgi:hypothetical protein
MPSPIFIGVQFNRLPSIGRFLGALYARGAEEMVRLTAVSTERMQGVLVRAAAARRIGS